MPTIERLVKIDYTKARDVTKDGITAQAEPLQVNEVWVNGIKRPDYIYGPLFKWAELEAEDAEAMLDAFKRGNAIINKMKGEK